MSNQWEAGDRLVVTRDCELGAKGEVVRVVSVDGPYMTVSVGSDEPRIHHTGRDYRFVTKPDHPTPERRGSREEAVEQILELLRSRVAILKAPYCREAEELAREHGVTALELIARAISLEIPRADYPPNDYLDENTAT